VLINLLSIRCQIVVVVLMLKSILGRSPKVKNFIEDPFQVGDLVGRRSH
jgi:hypothetical protein